MINAALAAGGSLSSAVGMSASGAGGVGGGGGSSGGLIGLVGVGAAGGGAGGGGNGGGSNGPNYMKKASMASNLKDGSVHHQIIDEENTYSDEDYYDDDDGDEFNPFRRTGCLFGSLCKEIKYRYSKYPSDFKDALNVHCLIAFVFIFTVCIAPALSFGGILGELSFVFPFRNELFCSDWF